MKKLLDAAVLILTLKCEQSSRIVSESFDRELTVTERWAVRLHHIGCWSCRRFSHQLNQIRAAMKRHPARAANQHSLTEDALHRIETAIQEAGSK